MELQNNQPIGVFDSGLGGLTVANAIKNLLPSEQIIYFGDTAHLPYGDKSGDLIRYYSVQIANFLLERQCKIIVIACNTASAYGFQAVKDYVFAKNPQVEIVNVIDPTVDFVVKNEKNKKIGVIGTKGTVSSDVYFQKIKEKNSQKEVVSLATALLVPMIEEGFVYDDISNAIIRTYLSQSQLQNIDTLILGCTHYPIIKNQIRKFYNFQTTIIDSSQIVANSVKNKLLEKNLLNTTDYHQAHQFYISDYTDYFKRIAEMFFEEEINLTKLDFWK